MLRTTSNEDSLGVIFRVSERGHNEHPDDFIIPSEEIIKLLMIANNPEKSPENS
jgi:hypothetical protein